MKRLLVLCLLLPIGGCAAFEDFGVFMEPETPSPCGSPPAVRACGGTGLMQTGANLPAQTQEPPR